MKFREEGHDEDTLYTNADYSIVDSEGTGSNPKQLGKAQTLPAECSSSLFPPTADEDEIEYSYTRTRFPDSASREEGKRGVEYGANGATNKVSASQSGSVCVSGGGEEGKDEDIVLSGNTAYTPHVKTDVKTDVKIVKGTSKESIENTYELNTTTTSKDKKPLPPKPTKASSMVQLQLKKDLKPTLKPATNEGAGPLVAGETEQMKSRVSELALGFETLSERELKKDT